MLKKFLFPLIVLFLVLFIALFFVGSGWINSLVKRGVETVGPQVTQSDVTLERVSLSIFSGSGRLSNLRVGNPEGFSDEDIIILGEVDLRLAPMSLLSDTIVIERLYVHAPRLRIEQSLKGNNLQHLMRNVQAYSPPTEDDPKKEGADKQILIKELIIEEGSILGTAFGQSIDLKLSRIELRDIGTGEGGLPVGQIILVVLSEVLKHAGPTLQRLGGNFRELGSTLQEQGGKAVDDAIGQGREALRGLFSD